MGKNKRFLIIVCILFPLAVIGILYLMIDGTSSTNDSVPVNNSYTSEIPTVTTMSGTSRWYDPALLSVGDKVGGWKVVAIETYGKTSNVFTLEGEAIISGTYKVTYEEDTYNSNQIVFVADEYPSSTLPQPLAFKGTASRMILHVVNPEDRNQFGPPGSKGHVAITIRQYHSVYADIIEGVADSAYVIQISQITTTPPPQTEVPQAELPQALQATPLPPFKMSTNADIADPDTYGLLQDWLKQLNKQFMTALSPFNTKRISPEQKEQIQTWLLLAFTEAKAKEVAAKSLPQSGIHYLIAYSLLDLFPFSEVKEIKNQSIQTEGTDTIRYTGVYILSGTYDAQFTYTLKHIDSVWKLDHAEIKQI